MFYNQSTPPHHHHHHHHQSHYHHHHHHHHAHHHHHHHSYYFQPLPYQQQQQPQQTAHFHHQHHYYHQHHQHNQYQPHHYQAHPHQPQQHHPAPSHHHNYYHHQPQQPQQNQPQQQPQPSPPEPPAASADEPWLPQLKKYFNVVCDKCRKKVQNREFVLEHPIAAAGRFCEQCAVEHGVLHFDAATGEFDHRVCHICDATDFPSVAAFKSHLSSRKHMARLKRLRSPVEAAIDEAYSSLFASALSAPSVCRHVAPATIAASLPEFEDWPSDFLHDQQVLLEGSSFREYAEATAASSALTAADEISGDAEKQFHDVYRELNSRLRCIKIINVDTMSRHDAELLAHDLRTTAVFGLDTETAPAALFPDARSQLGAGPQLLQLATSQRVWIIELSTTEAVRNWALFSSSSSSSSPPSSRATAASSYSSSPSSSSTSSPHAARAKRLFNDSAADAADVSPAPAPAAASSQRFAPPPLPPLPADDAPRKAEKRTEPPAAAQQAAIRKRTTVLSAPAKNSPPPPPTAAAEVNNFFMFSSVGGSAPSASTSDFISAPPPRLSLRSPPRAIRTPKQNLHQRDQPEPAVEEKQQATAATTTALMVVPQLGSALPPMLVDPRSTLRALCLFSASPVLRSRFSGAVGDGSTASSDEFVFFDEEQQEDNNASDGGGDSGGLYGAKKSFFDPQISSSPSAPPARHAAKKISWSQPNKAAATCFAPPPPPPHLSLFSSSSSSSSPMPPPAAASLLSSSLLSSSPSPARSSYLRLYHPAASVGGTLRDPYPPLADCLLQHSTKLLVGFATRRDVQSLATLIFGDRSHALLRCGVLDMSAIIMTEAVPVQPQHQYHHHHHHHHAHHRQHQLRHQGNLNNTPTSLMKLSPLRGEAPPVGMQQACARLFSRRFTKPKAISTSNWARRPLSRMQLLYAARDAMMTKIVFNELARKSNFMQQ